VTGESPHHGEDEIVQLRAAHHRPRDAGFRDSPLGRCLRAEIPDRHPLSADDRDEDEVTDPGRPRRLSQIARRDVIPLCTASEMQHRVHAFQRRLKAVAGDRVAFDVFHAGFVCARVTAEDADAAARGSKERDDATAYGSGSSSHQDRYVHGRTPCSMSRRSRALRQHGDD
jgi:hypothetical protein